MKPSMTPISAPRAALAHRWTSPGAAIQTTGIDAAKTIWVLLSITYREWLRRACFPYQEICWSILSNVVELFTNPPYKTRSILHFDRYCVRSKSQIAYCSLRSTTSSSIRAGCEKNLTSDFDSLFQ